MPDWQVWIIVRSTPYISCQANQQPEDKYRLPTWRYTIRQWLLPIVRIETPYVAWLQEYMRSPALDTYFAMSANLGTHTCFMVVLPMLYWCGSPFLGNAYVSEMD